MYKKNWFYHKFNGSQAINRLFTSEIILLLEDNQLYGQFFKIAYHWFYLKIGICFNELGAEPNIIK